MGTRLINLNEGDTVASVARLAAADLKLSMPEADEKANGRETEQAVTDTMPDETAETVEVE